MDGKLDERFAQLERTTSAVNPELSMGPFCVTQSNPTH